MFSGITFWKLSTPLSTKIILVETNLFTWWNVIISPFQQTIYLIRHQIGKAENFCGGKDREKGVGNRTPNHWW